jgi:hypothetical protein
VARCSSGRITAHDSIGRIIAALHGVNIPVAAKASIEDRLPNRAPLAKRGVTDALAL